MGPGRSRFWCPSLRLGALIVASAVVLNLFLHLFRPDIVSASSGSEDGSVERRRRRQEKHRRLIENFLGGRWQGAVIQDPVAAVVTMEAVEDLVAAPPVEALPARLRIVDFPATLPLLAEELRAWDPPSPNLEALLALPDRLIAAAAAALGAARPGDGGIIDRILDIGVERQQGSVISDFLKRLGEREQRYFGAWEESSIADTQDVDDFVDDQRRVLWDVLRKTYAARYRIRADESLKDAMFDPGSWRGVDLLVVPPLAAGYAMYRGVDRHFSFAGTRLRVAVEPLAEWRDDDVPAGVGLEWAPAGWPIALIVTAGLEDDNFKMDFIGIGTGIGMVRRALKQRLREDEPDR